MKKDTKMLLGIVAIGGAAYFLLKGKMVSGSPSQSSPLFDALESVPSGEDSPFTAEEQRQAREAWTKAQSKELTPEEGVNLINLYTSKGVQLPRLSRTLRKNITVNTPYGVQTGNIAQLADGSNAFVAVNQPQRDSQGLTATDRLILQREAKNRELRKQGKYVPKNREATDLQNQITVQNLFGSSALGQFNRQVFGLRTISQQYMNRPKGVDTPEVRALKIRGSAAVSNLGNIQRTIDSLSKVSQSSLQFRQLSNKFYGLLNA